MGLIFFLGINGLILYAVFGMLRKPKSFVEFLREFVLHPFIFTYQFIFIGSCLIAGWGVLSAGHLSWPIKTAWGTIQSWQLAGLVAFGYLAIGFLYSVYENDIKK